MIASPSDQRRLLDLADVDARIGRAEHARANPPHTAAVRQLSADRIQASQELAERLGTRDDLRAEIARLESDVAVVESRRVRDTERLAASSNVKEAQGLESELASLARRKSALEDTELELMERLEAAEAAVAESEERIAAITAEGTALSAEAKAAIASAGAEHDAASRDRAAVAGEIPGALLAQYERLAARGIGAAMLRRQTCEGCRMMLSGTDLNAVRNAPENEIVTCPECGCILVRTEESGL